MGVNQALQNFKAEFFKALANPTRIRILELLREGERAVGDLQACLEIDSSGVSQQLAVLRAKSIVQTRKEGTTVYYSIRDDRVFTLLDIAREIFDSHLVDLQAMLGGEAAAAASRTPPVRANSHLIATTPP
jgi:DNA-binding transcriptional ArsR family regulator